MEKIENSGAKIAPNNSTSLPGSNFQFGGFEVGGSKDGNATPRNSTYNYVKDKETGEGVIGWRVFDVDEDGRMILISAGCPEDYRNVYGANYAYISEYILTGNINSSVTSLDIGLGTTYLPRDWSMYENSKYGEVEAGVLTKARLDEWYTKYITEGTSANTWDAYTFRKIYKEDTYVVNEGKYESLIDNYSYYWLCSPISSTDLYYVFPNTRNVYGCTNQANGLRILLTMPSNTKLQAKSIETKTVISRDNEYTYNVWDFKTN